VRVISPEVRGGAQVAAGNMNWGTNIQGEGADYLDIRQWPLDEGAMFSQADVRSANKVAIIGKTIADQLFPEGDAIGKVIRIKNVPFVVVGVLASKGFNATSGQDQDDVVIVPYSSAMKRLFGQTNIRAITVSTRRAEDLASVQAQITDLLRQRHKITPGHDDDFTVRNQQDIADAANSTTETMRALLAGVALVSLLVGGIGIMNIMLVSVTERTREIGIRMAVGAHGKDILTQFLTEAVSLSVIGGGLGIFFGVFGCKFLTATKHWPTVTPTDWIVYAFLCSALVGIFFGFYPAWKASKLDPIDALRYE